MDRQDSRVVDLFRTGQGTDGRGQDWMDRDGRHGGGCPDAVGLVKRGDKWEFVDEKGGA